MVDNVFTCDLGIKGIGKVERYEVKNDSDFFITVSRLEAYKNISKSIEAFAILKRAGKLPDIKYYIIGTGPMENYLKDQINKNNLAEEVKLYGFVTIEKLLECYKNCLFIIHLPYDETFGLAYLEAAAFYKPSIASDQGGPKDIVIDGKTGLLVDPSNAVKIAEAIEKMCQDKVAREKMGQQANERLNDKYLWGKYIERFVAFIKQ